MTSALILKAYFTKLYIITVIINVINNSIIILLLPEYLQTVNCIA